jgi:hypothetical protein
MIPTLGTLSEASLRDAWDHEARSFTPWLAEHLDRLAEVIGIPLEFSGREVAINVFSADILARNPQDDSVVLIENQLEWTDHTHLGQIMTYLAGLDAQTVIWIAKDFHEAHLSAVKWLNEHTTAPFAFFAVRVKVVRIGDSPLAPVFEVLSRPSGWERQLQAAAQEQQAPSERGQFRQAFWNHYLDRYPDDSRDGPPGPASNRYRYIAALDVRISYFVAKNSVGIYVRSLHGTPKEVAYASLEPFAPQLASRLGVAFGGPNSIYLFGDEYLVNTSDRSRWDEVTYWLHDRLTLYTSALQEIG